MTEAEMRIRKELQQHDIDEAREILSPLLALTVAERDTMVTVLAMALSLRTSTEKSETAALKTEIRRLAGAFATEGSAYEKGGNTSGAAQLRRVSNFLYALERDGTALVFTPFSCVESDEIDETLLARSERLAAALLAELDKHPRETWLPVLASGISVAIEKETQPLREALEKIGGIRDRIIGAQTVNWSLDIYPLVAVLKAVGITGADYEKTRAALLEEFATAHCETCRALDKIEDIANEFGEKYGALAIIGEWVGEYRHAHQLRARKPDYKRRYEELSAATHESLLAHAVNEEKRADDLAKRLSATDQELVQLRTENRTLRDRLAAKGDK